MKKKIKVICAGVELSTKQIIFKRLCDKFIELKYKCKVDELSDEDREKYEEEFIAQCAERCII